MEVMLLISCSMSVGLSQAVKSWITRERTLVPDRLGVSSIVNAIGNSPDWANTPIFITWDDWGGW